MPAGKSLFQQYPNKIFIETGSLIGDAIQAALDSGFKTVYSIEIAKYFYDICVDRFRYNDNVHLILGDSGKELSRLLTMIKESATFWLDGHYSGGPVKGDIDSPLMQELDAISNHKIKTHTIIIDDLRCWTKESHGFDIKDIVEKISSINPDYMFIYANGQVENDILIAKV
jgi:hypothetical protein